MTTFVPGDVLFKQRSSWIPHDVLLIIGVMEPDYLVLTSDPATVMTCTVWWLTINCEIEVITA